MKKKRESRVVRAIRRTIRRPGVIVGVSCSLANGLGRLMGRSARILGRFSKPAKRSTRKVEALSAREAIRSIVTEELARLRDAEGQVALPQLQERLRIMAEAIEALQERIAELGARGPISDADMWKAVGSLEIAESLSHEERAILVNVFRQNVAIQKPVLSALPSASVD